MLFNSVEFFVFLPVVFTFYWICQKNLKLQNIFILAASYFFYGWWDWRFLSLIFLSTLVDFFVGLLIDKSLTHSPQKEKKLRKLLLFISIVFNLSLLGFFKYYNFFIESFVDSVALLGYQIQSVWTLKVILPVGISFYTFQTLSYTLDIYKGKIKSTQDFLSFAAFVSFFPQLVAGPIERASNLLPQFLQKRNFKYEQGVQGLRLILWGMFKKVAIADMVAGRTDTIFSTYQHLDSASLLLGAIYFSVQIYCDFSGYSDIAIGTAKLFGFELMSNFRFPYFSRNIGEFWRRWHISLSSWFRDYLYIPLGGSRTGKWRSLRNICITFLVSGFWHGSNWTFLAWGFVHALLFVPSYLIGTNRKHISKIVAHNKFLPSPLEIIQMLFTFFSVTIAWIFFRSPTLLDALIYIKRIFLFSIDLATIKSGAVPMIVFFAVLDWFLRKDERINRFLLPFKLHYLIYYVIFFITLGGFIKSLGFRQFIYFQF